MTFHTTNGILNLDEIWDFIKSVSESFPIYSLYKYRHTLDSGFQKIRFI